MPTGLPVRSLFPSSRFSASVTDEKPHCGKAGPGWPGRSEQQPACQYPTQHDKCLTCTAAQKHHDAKQTQGAGQASWLACQGPFTLQNPGQGVSQMNSFNSADGSSRASSVQPAPCWAGHLTCQYPVPNQIQGVPTDKRAIQGAHCQRSSPLVPDLHRLVPSTG